MKRSELKQSRGRTKNVNLLEKTKGNKKHKIKAVYWEIQAPENQSPGTPCFHRPYPIYFYHKMIRYKQGNLDQHNLLTSDCSSEAMMELCTSEHAVISQIIKIVLKVKLLWLSIPSHICDPALGKLLGKSIWRDAVQKQWKSISTSAVITNKAEVWFFFSAKEK